MKSLLALILALPLLSAPLGVSAMAATDDVSTPASDNSASATSRLVIVNGNTDEVIYDDGRDDLFCVTRVHRWRDENGYAHRRRTMHCR